MVDTMRTACTLTAALAAAMLTAPLASNAQTTMAEIRAKAIERCNTQHGVRCDTEDGLREFLAEEIARARGISPAAGGLPDGAAQGDSKTPTPATPTPGLAGTNPGITTTNPTQPAANPGNTGTLSGGNTAAGAPGTPTGSTPAPIVRR
jgi:hypothetical protein